MTITSKGQVTLPVSIRRRLHLEPGDRIDASIEGDKVLLRKVDSGGRFARAIEPTLAEEWLSDEDERAFHDL
jgi:AbrB family looped-hinge helix DNA binding protein